MSPGASQTDGGAAITGMRNQRAGEARRKLTGTRGSGAATPGARQAGGPQHHAVTQKTFQRGPRVPEGDTGYATKDYTAAQADGPGMAFVIRETNFRMW